MGCIQRAAILTLPLASETSRVDPVLVLEGDVEPPAHLLRVAHPQLVERVLEHLFYHVDAVSRARSVCYGYDIYEQHGEGGGGLAVGCASRGPVSEKPHPEY